MGRKTFGGTSVHGFLFAVMSEKRDVSWDLSAIWWVTFLGTGGISAIPLHFLFTSSLFPFFFFFFPISLPFSTYFKAISWQHDIFMECTVIFSRFLLRSEEADTSQLDLQLGLDNGILYKNLFSCGSFACSRLGKQGYFQPRLCKNIVMRNAI